MFHNGPPTVYVFRGSPRFGLQILLLGYILLCVKYGVACVCAQAVPLRIDRATLTVAASPLGIKPEASVLYVSPVSVTELPAPTMMAARLISVYPLISRVPVLAEPVLQMVKAAPPVPLHAGWLYPPGADGAAGFLGPRPGINDGLPDMPVRALPPGLLFAAIGHLPWRQRPISDRMPLGQQGQLVPF